MLLFQDVVKRFGTQTAVDHLTMTIERGEVVALLGPNGSGKTTTLKMAAGLIRPDAGQITVGDPPGNPLDPGVRRALSFLPQRVVFPDALTGREVVDFYSRLRALPGDRGDAVLRFASLNGAGNRAVGTYSGGMVQRLGLAVAMLPDSDVMLLDEPTAALDPEGLCSFYGLVERRRTDGRTVLFTSHQVGDVERLADRFLVLVRGRVVAGMTQAALRDRLAERGVIRVRLDRRPAALLEAVRRICPAAKWIGDELVAPGPAAVRPVVLDLVRASGAQIHGLLAEDGRLEALYRDLVADREAGGLDALPADAVPGAAGR
jgi:Cu-processing system ATP-binding protein